MKHNGNLKQISKLWLISFVYIINLCIKISNKGISKIYTTSIGFIFAFIVIILISLIILTAISKNIRRKIASKIKFFTSNIGNLIYLIIILIAINFYGEESFDWLGIFIAIVWLLICLIFVFRK